MFTFTLKVIQNIGKFYGYSYSLKLNLMIKFEQLQMFSNIRIIHQIIFSFPSNSRQISFVLYMKTFHRFIVLLHVLFKSLFENPTCAWCLQTSDNKFLFILTLNWVFFFRFSYLLLYCIIQSIMTNEWSGPMIIDEIE
jgi:hypothetical protein